MPRVMVWECPNTGLLFKNEYEYRDHLRGLSNIRRAQRREEDRKRRSDEHLSEIRNCTSLDEIAAWLVDNFPMIRANNRNTVDDKRGGKLTRVLFSTGGLGRDDFNPEKWVSNLSWCDEVSNSHESPRGRPTNWCGRNKNCATGHPGWTGRIKLYFEKYCRATPLLKIASIKTGTGGGGGEWSTGGSNTAEYEVKLFAEDFPGLVYGLGVKPVFKPYGSRGEIINYMDDERFVPLNRMFFYGGKLLRPDVRYYLETHFWLGEKRLEARYAI